LPSWKFSFPSDLDPAPVGKSSLKLENLSSKPVTHLGQSAEVVFDLACEASLFIQREERKGELGCWAKNRKS
jgi:hypothetical protein